MITDTVDDYSLAEEPHPDDAEWRSDSDPTDAADRIKDIVRRYLELQPHEQANLSVALYNCESAGLPIAAIEALSDLQEADVHCHVVLRHENVAVLRRVYTELLEHADTDPDALVASETSKNFMANLRVGIQLETPTSLGLPHLDGGLIVEQPQALSLLEEMVAEMDRRYSLFRDTKVNKLASYNAKVGPTEALPVVFIVHDEFAEWMLTEKYRDSVTALVSRLGVKARAAGIHLLFAAQRPNSTVMPMQLRDNLGNRLLLRVEGEGTSEIALGMKGAERLLGRGHVAARLSGEPDVIFGQVPFLSDEEIFHSGTQLGYLGEVGVGPRRLLFLLQFMPEWRGSLIASQPGPGGGRGRGTSCGRQLTCERDAIY